MTHRVHSVNCFSLSYEAYLYHPLHSILYECLRITLHDKAQENYFSQGIERV